MDTIVITLLVLAALLVIAGVAGLFFPALPGAPLLFSGLLLAAWAEDFHYVDFRTLTLLLALTVPTYFGDMLSSRHREEQYATRWRAVIGAVLGGVAGLFLDLTSALVGLLVGALLAELTVRRQMMAFRHTLFGAPNGMIERWILEILGTIIKVALAIAMIGIFLYKRLL